MTNEFRDGDDNKPNGSAARGERGTVAPGKGDATQASERPDPDHQNSKDGPPAQRASQHRVKLAERLLDASIRGSGSEALGSSLRAQAHRATAPSTKNSAPQTTPDNMLSSDRAAGDQARNVTEALKFGNPLKAARFRRLVDQQAERFLSARRFWQELSSHFRRLFDASHSKLRSVIAGHVPWVQPQPPFASGSGQNETESVEVSMAASAAGNSPSTSQASSQRREQTSASNVEVKDPASNKNGTAAANGGGGDRAAPQLQRRFSDRDFREVLTRGLQSVRMKLAMVAFFSFWVNLLILAIPIYLFNISDRVLTSRSFDTLVMLTIVIAAAVLGHVVLDMVRRFMLMRIAVEVECKLGAPVLAAAAKASQGGSIREYQILPELQSLRNFITGPVLLIMFDAPIAPIYLLAVFLIHPQLGWIVTSSGAILILFALINQKLTAAPFAQASAFAVRANLQADAMARNSQVINAMGMIPESVLIWGRETVESLTSQVTAQDRNIVMAGMSKFVRQGTQILMLGWGASLALDGQLTGGMMIAASIISGRALAPVESVIDGWRSFVQARSAFMHVRALLLNSPLNLARLELPRPEGRLSVERILYVPGASKKVILNGVTFTLEPGESLAIVGASGTGKSTLGRMLVGSIGPTAGSVRLDMMDLRNWDPRQLGQCIGYLPQDVQLFPGTIKANIARMRDDVADSMIYDAAELADVHDLISQFPQGYETFIGVDGSPLSGGQRQRIGLARAFFGDPRLIVLDEPNSNLDTPGEMALALALERAKKRNATVVAITQRPALLQSVDKIMILREGVIQALGPRNEIIPMVVGRPPGAPALGEQQTRLN